MYFGRYLSDANSVVNATTLDPVTLEPVSVNQSFVTPRKTPTATFAADFKINKQHTLVGRANYSVSTQDLQGIGGFCAADARVPRAAQQLHSANDRDRDAE